MDTAFSYTFPALRGYQAEKEYYVVMCPLRLIPKIFLFNEEEIPAQHRAQRILNKNRVPEITNYILDNTDNYVFSSLTASIDGEMEFQPFSEEKTWDDLGRLQVSLDSRFLINDGQHRRAAIEEALKISPELGEETISVVFFADEGLKNSQQIFADLNRHAVNTTTSIGILYDHRDQLALLTKDVVSENELLARYTDTERVNLSKNSPKLVALNHIFNTILRLLGKSKGDLLDETEEKFVKEFWEVLCESIPEWKMVFNKEMSPKELRTNFIVGHGVFLEAVGLVGKAAYEQDPSKWKNYIRSLKKIDWSRTNTKDWEGRAFSTKGRIQKTNLTIQLTANLIKEKVGLKLSESNKKQERKFKEAKGHAK
ncbi:DNA sulfur modification protein DndB [Allobacillus sp. GCM10007491]|uniref:DNA sulfur modification protein DndB n=1 Tax=Allobacillus saliphilus TaxID=2912308 RepID=A0A941HTC3_9BACI|nr:DNA sulfur modification protein DndB [Allobacillus saliphilus]MBR7553630.1 DNA sulfur modification protein DndB [Allobacillus saliphilus]